MQSKKLFNIMMLVLMLLLLTVNVAFAEGGEPAAPSAFTGTVFSLTFLYVMGIGGIVLWGSSKNAPEVKKYKKASKR